MNYKRERERGSRPRRGIMEERDFEFHGQFGIECTEHLELRYGWTKCPSVIDCNMLLLLVYSV